MTRGQVRILLTIFLYAGVGMALYPYFSGTLSTGMLLLIGGVTLTVVCGILRCLCLDGDCSERTGPQHVP